MLSSCDYDFGKVAEDLFPCGTAANENAARKKTGKCSERMHGSCLHACVHRHITMNGLYFSSKKKKSCTELFQANL
ncbi:hypothetical protein AB205_0126890 [Aquarana catesbeiana]|uniref:Uncharacterized protein n=1 Tax=Aquarana catesbeiana TaxID=8400 RepID=A0A2G9R7N7_AQUCT|nr:hypothetical protein AB205_0126890 [Aquarana catesbeiana]